MQDVVHLDANGLQNLIFSIADVYLKSFFDNLNFSHIWQLCPELS